MSRFVVLALFACCTCSCAAGDVHDSLPPPHFPDGQAGPGGPALFAEAHRELQSKRTTKYAHVTRVDELEGVFEYDCSGFADYAISNVAPDALASLRRAGATKRPNARTYVQLLSAIPDGQSRQRWRRIANAAELLPGDVIAWLAVNGKPDFLDHVNSGHVMLVDEPARERTPGEWVVAVVDASAGHGGADERHKPDATGLGRGTIVLVTENGAPVGYRWSESAGSALVHTSVVLGRIL